MVAGQRWNSTWATTWSIGGALRLEAGIGYRPTWLMALGRFLGRAPLASYLGAIFVVWSLAVIATAALGARLGMVRIAGPVAALVLLTLFAGAAGQFAVSLVNWLCTLLAPPRPMMRLDFSAGIPAEHRTLVAVPALLTSERTVRDLVEQLELRYLANQDDNLWFALLSDFPDADQETLAGDPRLLELARTEIQRLNERYRADRPGVFYLLHRPRKWNRQQGAWMGEERKRGKLAALNRLLQSGAAEAFSATLGDLPLLRSVRYVITLDSDTQLPRDTGRELVGCAAHPLNQARFQEDNHQAGDPHSRVVVAGYAVLQPRITATLSGRIAAASAAWRRAMRESILIRFRPAISTTTCLDKAVSSAKGSTTWRRSSRPAKAVFPKTAC